MTGYELTLLLGMWRE